MDELKLINIKYEYLEPTHPLHNIVKHKPYKQLGDLKPQTTTHTHSMYTHT
jgi:hypothetical protein